MIERFESENRPALVESLKRQEFTGGDHVIAEAMIAVGTLLEFKPGEKLITEGATDNHIFLLVAGSVAVVIKGTEVRTLNAGQHVGEMAAIEPSQPRSASVIAEGTVVALQVNGRAFVQLCDRFPIMWKPLAKEIARRLYDRNRLMSEPNQKPKLFIISSVEALDVAREIAAGLQYDVLPTVWTDGVFWASHYPLENLETAVSQSDFAVAVAQFEDFVEMKGERRATLRDNVLFELGLFMGKLGRRRTILVHPRRPDIKLPTDLHGLIPVAYLEGKPEDVAASLGPACTQIRKIIKSLGVKTGTS